MPVQRSDVGFPPMIKHPPTPEVSFIAAHSFLNGAKAAPFSLYRINVNARFYEARGICEKEKSLPKPVPRTEGWFQHGST